MRVFHWSLVFFFTLAYVTGEELDVVHAYAGYVIIGLLLFRIVWGFIGGKYARFSQFMCGPGKTLAYIKSIIRSKPRHYLGHNPLGGWMTVSLLVFLSISVWSGLEAYADEGKGPLAQTIEFVQPAYADVDRHDGAQKKGDEFWKELHEFFADVTLALVFLHIGGVLFSSVVHRENLVKAMINGYKKITPNN